MEVLRVETRSYGEGLVFWGWLHLRRLDAQLRAQPLRLLQRRLVRVRRAVAPRVFVALQRVLDSRLLVFLALLQIERRREVVDVRLVQPVFAPVRDRQRLDCVLTRLDIVAAS